MLHATTAHTIGRMPRQVAVGVRRVSIVLGIDDPWILGVYLLCILSAISCIAYGLINWNKGGEQETAEISEEVDWETQEAAQEKDIGL